jgi:phosphate transport system substrate-binding protein
VKRSVRNTMTAAIVGGALFATAATALAETKGSGASFPRLAYQTWCQESGGLCSYTSKGSTGGINDFIGGVVDFGASDAPLSDAQRADLASKRGGAGVLYFPTLLGAVTIPTNMAGQPGALQIRAKTLGRIFAGEITTWNDPAIVGDNATNPRTKGFKFPAQPIVVCVRQDGSGTSFAFSSFLSKASAPFKAKVGVSQLPAWTAPQVVKAPGNVGVASCVTQNSGSIGYVDLGDARNAGLGKNLAAVGKSEVIRVKRKVRGKVRTVSIRRLTYKPPSVPAIIRAGNVTAKQIPSSLLLDLSLSPAIGAYPIVTTTWVLAYTDFNQAGKGASLAGVKSVLNYFYSTGAQARLSQLGFAPLPATILAAAKKQMTLLK